MGEKANIPDWALEFKMFCFKNGLNLKKVAELVGISCATISGYSTGKKRPSIKTCKKIQEKIGFDMLTALYLSDKKEIEGGENERNESKI